MDEDDITRQAEEIEALSSIYGDQWQTEDECSLAFSVRLSERNEEVVLYVTLPPDYPSHSPPFYQVSAPSLNREDKSELTGRLENIYLDHIGENILYQWAESIKEFLQERVNQNFSEEQIEEVKEPIVAETSFNDQDSFIHQNTPLITHGEIISDRKSIFQGHVATITSVDQVKLVLSKLMLNKKISNATHNMYAYRVLKDGRLVQDCEDDGEAAAGGRMLHLLQIMNVMNVVVVVTRWYGGIHLGPDRFRHINNAARQALQASGVDVKKK